MKEQKRKQQWQGTRKRIHPWRLILQQIVQGSPTLTPFGLNSDTIVHKIATKLCYLHLVNVFSNVNRNVKKKDGKSYWSPTLMSTLDFRGTKKILIHEEISCQNPAKILGQGFFQFSKAGDSKELKYFMSLLFPIWLQFERKFYFCRISILADFRILWIACSARIGSKEKPHWNKTERIWNWSFPYRGGSLSLFELTVHTLLGIFFSQVV